jgi:hypothetical protein
MSIRAQQSVRTRLCVRACRALSWRVRVQRAAVLHPRRCSRFCLRSAAAPHPPLHAAPPPPHRRRPHALQPAAAAAPWLVVARRAPRLPRARAQTPLGCRTTHQAGDHPPARLPRLPPLRRNRPRTRNSPRAPPPRAPQQPQQRRPPGASAAAARDAAPRARAAASAAAAAAAAAREAAASAASAASAALRTWRADQRCCATLRCGGSFVGRYGNPSACAAACDSRSGAGRCGAEPPLPCAAASDVGESALVASVPPRAPRRTPPRVPVSQSSGELTVRNSITKPLRGGAEWAEGIAK